MNEVVQLRKLRDFGERIGDTMQFIKFNWLKLLGVYAVFVIPFLLVGIILGAYGFADFMTNSAGSLDAMKGLVSVKLIIALLMFILSGASYTAAVYLYMDHYDKTNGIAPTISELGKKFTRKFLSNVGYTILAVTLIVLVGSFLALGFYFLKSAVFMLILMVPVGLIFGLFAMVYLSMMYPVNVFEGEKYKSVIGGTFHLLKGRWWFSVGYLLVLTIIFYFFSTVISGIVSLLFGLSAINMLDASGISRAGKSYAYVFGLTTLLQQVFYLVLFVGSGIHYYSITEEKAGAGLEQKIDQLGSESKQENRNEETW